MRRRKKAKIGGVRGSKELTRRHIVARPRAPRIIHDPKDPNLEQHIMSLHRGRYAFSKQGQKLRPFILTCDLRIDQFSKFVESYLKIASSMLAPVVIMDDTTTSGDEQRRYHDLIIKLKPHVIISQPKYTLEEMSAWDDRSVNGKHITDNRKPNYYRVQMIMTKDFPEWALEYSDGPIIFMEDDIEFSSQFGKAIKECSSFVQEGLADFITLYSSREYSLNKRLKSYKFLQPFNGYDYYGNLCVVFSRKVLESLKKNKHKVRDVCPNCWDVRWGRYMHDKGFKMYVTRTRYVKHLAGLSALEHFDKPGYQYNFQK
ncbi:MAG: hypothetical protein CMF69_00350 [Magnetovibrio sp.]|nr:hypothetical protein [Magnetovibrio sp.]